jgi:glutaredoxin
MIQVFSTSTCSACVALKKFMKDQNIPFVERHVEEDRDAYDTMVRLGVNAVPMVYLTDEDYFVGFKPAQVLEMAKKV